MPKVNRRLGIYKPSKKSLAILEKLNEVVEKEISLNIKREQKFKNRRSQTVMSKKIPNIDLLSEIVDVLIPIMKEEKIVDEGYTTARKILESVRRYK